MATVLKSKPGLSSTTTLNIPTTWDATWFRNFISNQLKGADVRNAVGANGITVSGTIASPYATISGAGLISSVVGTANQILVSTVGGVATVSIAPNTIIPTPASGNALTVNGAANGNSLFVQNTSATGTTFGIAVSAGSNASDYSLKLNNSGGTTHVLVDGSGAVTIAAPSIATADALKVTGPSSGNALHLVSGLAVGSSCWRLDGCATTGAVAAVFTAANKPGTGTTVTKWLPIALDGVQYWIPCWAN